LRQESIAQSAENESYSHFPAVCTPGLVTTFDTGIFSQVVEGMWQPDVTVTLLLEAQIDTHLIFQEMARSKNAPSNRTFNMAKFNRIWEGMFMTSVISCKAVHL